MISKIEMKRRRELVIQNWELNSEKGIPITKLAKECNVTPETYRKYLREVGYDPKGVKFTYTANRAYFNKIDTEEKAYWLGFIYADGNISIKEGQFYIMSISLAKKDEEHLYKFLNSIEANFKIYDKESPNPNNPEEKLIQARLDISSKEMCRDLIKYGCIPNKSLKKSFPKLKEPFIQHFLRGYFDGNGSIIFSSRKYLTVQLASSEIFLNQMQDYLGETLQLKHKKVYKPKKAKSDKWGIWKCVTVEAETLLNYLYDNSSIHLERKHQKYKDIVDYKLGNIGES